MRVTCQILWRSVKPLLSYSTFAAVTFRDLVTMTFDLGHWSYMAGRMVNPCTKFEDPTLIRS